jgi:hypothetical protein
VIVGASVDLALPDNDYGLCGACWFARGHQSSSNVRLLLFSTSSRPPKVATPPSFAGWAAGAS